MWKFVILSVNTFFYLDAITEFFSWKGFLVTTRISYAVYLTQFPIFFYNVGQTRSAEHYDFIRMTVIFNN